MSLQEILQDGFTLQTLAIAGTGSVIAAISATAIKFYFETIKNKPRPVNLRKVGSYCDNSIINEIYHAKEEIND